MEAQLQRPTHGLHHSEEDPRDKASLHSSAVGSDGLEEHSQQGEKKSVLKKVKDKAKKIKDTITKHGHGHEPEHDQISEEEEEMVNAPDVHSAPKYDQSPVIPGTNLPIQTSVNLEKPTEDRYNHSVRKEAYPHVGSEGVLFTPSASPSPSPSPSASGQGNKMMSHRPEIQNPLRPSVRGREGEVGVEPTIRIGPLKGLGEDPHEIPPSNYQSKVADPTDVDPLIRRLDNLHVSKQQQSYTGSRDQFSPQPTPPINPEPSPELPESCDSTHAESVPQDTITGKISYATSVMADKAISAKNVVASKLGYGGGHQDLSKKPAPGLVAEYGHKVAETLAPVYEKVAVMSKVQRSGGGAEQSTEGVSVREYLAEKFRPGEEDKALSEAIADAFHKKKEGMGQPPVAARQVLEKEEAAAMDVGGDSPGAAISSWLGKSGSAHGGAAGSNEDVSRKQ